MYVARCGAGVCYAKSKSKLNVRKRLSSASIVKVTWLGNFLLGPARDRGGQEVKALGEGVESGRGECEARM